MCTQDPLLIHGPRTPHVLWIIYVYFFGVWIFRIYLCVCVCGDIERATALWLDSGKWHDYKIKAAIDFNHCKSADYL